MMLPVPGPAVRRFRPRPAARWRVVCFPPAGGAASFFRTWPARLPDDGELWAIQYPGREDRLAEPVPATLTELADALVPDVEAAADRPLVLVGHSMGASVAHEVTRRLEARGVPGLGHLVVAGRPGPTHQRAVASALHRLDDEQLTAHLRRLGGTPDAVLDDPELRPLVLGGVRRDYRLVETYRPTLERIATPILALVGDRDGPDPVTAASSWAAATTGPFTLRAHAGGHFFVRSREDAVVRDVVAAASTQPSTP